MSDNRNMPQVEAESVEKGSQKARYNAYVQEYRKLKLKAKADKTSRENAVRMGGAV